MTDTDVIAFVIAWLLVSAAIWLTFSAITSFVHLEWRACTDTELGRGLFAGVDIWLTIAMLRK